MRTLSIVFLLVLTSVAPAGELDRNLKDLQGNPASIEAHVGQGKWLLVMIWATTCSICYQEAPNIAEFHANHKDEDATVLGVALDGHDNLDSVQKFITDRGMQDFPNVIAEMPDFAYRYEVDVGERLFGTPTFLLFSPDGALVANNPGPVRPTAVETFIANNATN